MAGQDDRRLFQFPYHLDMQTRWLDNDQYVPVPWCAAALTRSFQIRASEQFFVLVCTAIVMRDHPHSPSSLIADSVSNTYLHDSCGVIAFPHAGQKLPSEGPASVIGLVISSSADYFAPTSFPDTLRCGLRVVQLGNSSVTYEVGIFAMPGSTKADAPQSSATSSSHTEPKALASDALASVLCRVTHVFVNRETRRPVKPMPKQLHDGLSKLIVPRFCSKPKL